MTELEGFLNFVRDRLAETDEPLPCEPEDCAAVLGYLAALVPEYEIARQTEAEGSEARRADRRQAVLDGFRRVRGASANGNGGDGRPRDNGANDGRPRIVSNTGTPNPGRRPAPSDNHPPEAA